MRMVLAKATLLAFTVLASACAGVDDLGPSADEIDGAFSGKADDLGSSLRPAWPERRVLSPDGTELEDQVLHYEPAERIETETEDGTEISFERPDDAWREFGRYQVEVDHPATLRVELSGRGVGPLSALVAIRRSSADGGGTSAPESAQTDQLELSYFQYCALCYYMRPYSL